MKKNKWTKLLLVGLVCSTVALNYSPAFAANSSWSAQPISDFVENKIEAPTVLNDEKYTKYITREEFSQLIVGLYAKSENISKENIPTKENPFKDTANIDVQRAYSLGIIQGVGKNTFDPNKNITREQIATMLTRFLNIKKIDTSSTNSLNGFTDKNDISTWAFDSLAYCVDNQIIQGSENQLQPKESTTVEQAITMLDRIAIKNNWITQSNDLYLYGFLLPNNTELNYKLIDSYTFKLEFNWNNVKDTEKIKQDLNYMFNKKFKENKNQINEIIEAVIKTKQGGFHSDDFTINESKTYRIWVWRNEYTTEINIENSSDMGEIPPIPSAPTNLIQ
ncbi:S-layer homology domain-containing protein [Clostridium aminobutyricum]|uniref:S-layer homology domain-containing protein n=1 Tax=Clostridium aminobutyricum TaxID=33953 RepID=A0A939IHH8_CLOAM|nr:S-layer homology domain-containing protein [Clostridium aminobutyricum]MBN7771971.1 S-layer homology domain-containing protein [Clostridium aminobutyricum]